MIPLLKKLHDSLQLVFDEKLGQRDKHVIEEESIDVFATLMSLSKTEKALTEIMESSSIPKESLRYEFGRDEFREAEEKGFLRKGKGINDHKYFISTTGLYHLYVYKGYELYSVFRALDDRKFPTEEHSLKPQEKIWCIFLILFGADCKAKCLDTSTTDPYTLDDFFKFLQLIEKEINETGITLGKDIKWNKGKETSFRSFITSTKDLPKTGLYHYQSKKYWLDLSTRRNVIYLIDLILSNYKEEERILSKELLYNSLYVLSNKMLLELGVDPKDLNKYLVEELKN